MSAAEQSNTRLIWPVRRSFVGYVQGVGGRITMLDGASHDGDAFIFPGGRVSPRRWEFVGAVVFQAHRGILEVGLASPAVELANAGADLTVATRPDGSGRILLATVGDLASGFEDVRLTEDGSALFGGSYPAGERIDGFRIDEDA